MRSEFSKATKLEAYRRAAGNCEGCTAKLFPGKFDYDHILPDQLGGKPTVDNCRVLCDACHSVKTFKSDIPRIAKAKRQEAAHLGAKTKTSRPLPGGRNSPFKLRMDGTVVRRTP